MEFTDRKSVNDTLEKYGGLDKPIEVIEWTNGGGWDICVDEKLFQLSYAELEAINHLTKSLIYYDPGRAEDER